MFAINSTLWTPCVRTPCVVKHSSQLANMRWYYYYITKRRFIASTSQCQLQDHQAISIVTHCGYRARVWYLPPSCGLLLGIQRRQQATVAATLTQPVHSPSSLSGVNSLVWNKNKIHNWHFIFFNLPCLQVCTWLYEVTWYYVGYIVCVAP